MLFDTHTHLESQRYDADRDAVIARAREAGIERMVTCGSDLPTSRACLELADAHDGIYAAVGIHPHEAWTAASAVADSGEIVLFDAAFGELADMAAQGRTVALGEMGLDYYYDLTPRPVQRAVLARQLELAAEIGLPVILHNRQSDDDLRSILEASSPRLRGVLHCFLADATLAAWALERGLYLGMGGPLTFRKVVHLEDIVRWMPRERLLLETDCPYLAPQPKRGRRNEPAYLRHVAERVAQIWNVSLEAVAEQTTANANRLFGLA